jgi:hypothetical protein
VSAPALSSRPRLIFLRGLIWSLIGLIYAPLFTALRILFRDLGLNHWSFVPAAAIAGAIGAAFYGARQVALVGTMIGLVAGTLAAFVLPAPVQLWPLVLVGGAIGLTVGGIIRFPDRCSYHVPGKTLAGLITGAAAGAALSLVEPLHPEQFHIAGVVAFLVSVNGVLYVVGVRWFVGVATMNGGQPCHLIQALVIGLLAGTAAGSLWVVASPLLEATDARYVGIIDTIVTETPLAIMGGMLGGAVGGMMLEAFRFHWVHEV